MATLERSSEPDLTLIKLLLKAETLRTMLLTGGVASIEEIAQREGVTGSCVTRLLRLAFLAPDITAAILHGRHSPEFTAANSCAICVSHSIGATSAPRSASPDALALNIVLLASLFRISHS
jgi:hypothetical protein